MTVYTDAFTCFSVAQAGVNIAAMLATIAGPFTIAALVKRDPHTGWRLFFVSASIDHNEHRDANIMCLQWFQAALWGGTVVALLVGYNPPKRHTNLDSLSFWQKVGRIDFAGCGLLTVGLTLFIVGASLGGGQYAWTDPAPLSTLIIGIVTLIAFGLYEWKGTKTGILNHDLFRGGRNQGRTFALCVLLMFLEAVMVFGFALFYPILTQMLFTTDPLVIVARSMAAWIPALVATVFWASISTRFRTIREPLLAGFIILTAGLVGLCTVEPGQSVNAIAFSVLLGIGFGAPLILVVTGVQLSTPHRLIATATACTTSSRAVAGAMFSAVNVAAFNTRLGTLLPEYVAKAALAAGLPEASLPAFIGALSTGDAAALAEIPGVTPAVIAAGVGALQQAFADAIRVIFIIAAPFGVVAIVACCFLGDLKETMNYRVDAPVEKLQEKHGRHDGATSA